MGGLEHPHRLERRRFVRPEQELLEVRAVLRRNGQLSQQARRRRERHLPLRLVTDDRERMRKRRPRTGLGQQTALPASRLADDDRQRGAGLAIARDLGQSLQLHRSADEGLHLTLLS